MEKVIEFEGVSKTFGNTEYAAVDKVSFSVNEGEFVTILGSSGCGKTTLIKLVNRLYEPDSGTIRLSGKNIAEENAVNLRRGIGYVIQQAGLFPHMTVSENIATVPRLLGWEKERVRARGEELLKMVGMEPSVFGSRYHNQLSGGQQQRIGLARALAADPEIMLLDEPFGAIDAINRMKLQDELKRLHERLKKTVLFVTHDINEAFKLGTRVMIMNEGKILRFDTPENLVQNPGDPFVEALIRAAREQEEFWRNYID